MKLIYQILIGLYGALIQLGSLRNKKAKSFIEGRKNLDGLWVKLGEIPVPRVWFHFPSLGEFEQGRPVLEKWHHEFPDHKIIISFFSPSGYEVRKNYPLASLVCYLPLDTPKHARAFIQAVNPSLVFFTKYDLWHFYIEELKLRNIPIVLISAIFRPKQIYFKPFGSFFRSILENIDMFYVQDEESMKLLKGIGIHKVLKTGDTRFDRVWEISKNPIPVPELDRFLEGNKVFVGGSTWPKDESLIRRILDLNVLFSWKIILVPHEIDENHLKKIDDLFGHHSVRFSEWLKEPQNQGLWMEKSVIIIDQIGILSSLYQKADLVYIGNGFGSGIHNTLEAAIYGKPLIFGPHYSKFKEARDFIDLGAGFSFHDFDEMVNLLEKLQKDSNLIMAGKKAREYCLEKRGATNRILEDIQGRFKPWPFPQDNLPN